MRISHVLAILVLLTIQPPPFTWCQGNDADGTDVGGSLDSTSDPLVCVVIRTFWGHGDDYGDQSLRTLLGALQAQQFTRWEAMLLVMDNRPFPELRRILRDFHDDRIWVHAELINYQYEPKTQSSSGAMTWAPGYHNKLYNLTDSAIRACAPSTEWVLVTNGDNDYDALFMDFVVAAPPQADAIAFNYYSRYQRPTMTPCERFAADEALPQCKENEFRVCQTDTSANVFRWSRLLEEDRRFAVMDPGGQSWGANDGLLAHELLVSGWKVHRVHRCLVDHGPSPQQCAMAGGVWDDSNMLKETSYGGECIDSQYAAGLVAADRGAALEQISLPISFDADSFDFHELQGEPLTLSCLRRRNASEWSQGQAFFGRACAASVDKHALPAYLPPHPLDDWVGDLPVTHLADEL